jgi:hypothetical protein
MDLDQQNAMEVILHQKFAALGSNDVLIHCLHLQAQHLKEQIVTFNFSTKPDEQLTAHSYLAYLKGQLSCISKQLTYLTTPVPTNEET